MSISILVPFRSNSVRDPRIKTWNWLRERWSHIMPEAEICEGTDHGGQPFSKSAAINDAYEKSTGDMLIIADADSWVERGALITGIEAAQRKEHLVIPWMKSYRLTKKDSDYIMKLAPGTKNVVTKPMKDITEGTGPAPDSAAMVLIIQRQAFERVGGFDPRFRGWGSEDVSFGLSCWTLLGRNEFVIGEAYALYHHRPLAKVQIPNEPDEHEMRHWHKDEGGRNFPLWHRYKAAQGYPGKMLPLCAEHALPGKSVSLSPTWDASEMEYLEREDGSEVLRPQMARQPLEDHTYEDATVRESIGPMDGTVRVEI